MYTRAMDNWEPCQLTVIITGIKIPLLLKGNFPSSTNCRTFVFNWMQWRNSEGLSISKNCLWFYKMSIENNNMVRNAVVVAIIPRLWEMTQKGASLCTKWSERHFLDWKTCSVKWWCTIGLSKIWTCMRKVNVKYFFLRSEIGKNLEKG